MANLFLGRLSQRGRQRSLVRTRTAPDGGLPSVGPGVFYAVGDIHGRADLLIPMLAGIRKREANTPPSDLTVIFLGDFVDRGPQSSEVVEIASSLAAQGWCKVLSLKGNHEELLLRFLQSGRMGREWLKIGGGATLSSYGVQTPQPGAPSEVWKMVHAAFVASVPATHVDFLESLKLYFVSGDYVFVHAGVKPNVPLAQQSERDLLWIRGEFTRCEQPMNKVVVYGHTPSPAPVIEGWKIGLDTGAYASGVLTGMRLEGDRRQIVQVT